MPLLNCCVLDPFVVLALEINKRIEDETERQSLEKYIRDIQEIKCFTNDQIEIIELISVNIDSFNKDHLEIHKLQQSLDLYVHYLYDLEDKWISSVFRLIDDAYHLYLSEYD
jgi:hypothetical protein